MRVYVHSLSCAPGVTASDKERLLHRELPGWGIMHCTGTVADCALLLIADELVVDDPWTRGQTETEAHFRDAGDLLERLRDQRLVALVDSKDAWGDASARITAAVQAGLQEPGPWLTALRDGGHEWGEQEALAARLWAQTRPDGPEWSEHLRRAGVSGVRHNYRNQSQAITALIALQEWDNEAARDASLLREALGRELLYLHASVNVSAALGVVPHDWSDFAPLYALLGTPGASPALSLRLPGLRAEAKPSVADLLADRALGAVREMTAAALAGDKVSAADIERELLRVVPRECRAPYAYRLISFYRYAPDLAARMGLPDEGMYAVSAWRVTGVDEH